MLPSQFFVAANDLGRDDFLAPAVVAADAEEAARAVDAQDVRLRHMAPLARAEAVAERLLAARVEVVALEVTQKMRGL